eukprot:s1925_g8.t1
MLDKPGPLTSCPALPSNLLSRPHITYFSFFPKPFRFFYREEFGNMDNISRVVQERSGQINPGFEHKWQAFSTYSKWGTQKHRSHLHI